MVDQHAADHGLDLGGGQAPRGGSSPIRTGCRITIGPMLQGRCADVVAIAPSLLVGVRRHELLALAVDEKARKQARVLGMRFDELCVRVALEQGLNGVPSLPVDKGRMLPRMALALVLDLADVEAGSPGCGRDGRG